MKGKKLEILVLVVSFAILATAMFLMFAKGGTENDKLATMSMVNRLFSVGFLVYIAYSYLLSNNLNKEIGGLEKNVDNLKKEVARMRKKNEELTATVSQKDSEISTLSGEKSSLEKDVDSLKKQLTKAKSAIKKLEQEASQESKEE